MADVSVRYVPNEEGWNRIALSPEILEACMDVAKRGKRFAEAIAPRSGDGKGTPYADSFDVEATTVKWFRTGPRVAARLVNDAPHAAAIEFGNKQTPKPSRVLGRTAAYLGSG